MSPKLGSPSLQAGEHVTEITYEFTMAWVSGQSGQGWSRTVRPAMVISPARISAFRCDLDNSSRRAASTRSRRWPCSPDPTLKVSKRSRGLSHGVRS